MISKFSPKKVGETITISFDYSLLIPNESIVNNTYTVETYSGIDMLPNDILLDSPIISGKKTFQKITGGFSGNSYLIKNTINTSLGNTLIEEGILAIV